MFNHFGTIGKLASLALITLVCLLIALVVGTAGAMIYAKLSATTVAQTFSYPNYVRLYQILSSLIIFLIPALVCAWLFDTNIKNGLYLNTQTNWKSMLLALTAMITVIPFTAYITELNMQLSLPDCMKGIEEWMRQKEDRAKIVTEQILITDNFWLYLYNIIVLALVPAISEELFFRATLQKIITQHRPLLAAVITAVIFSAFHLQFYGFLPRVILGFMLGFMIVCTQNIRVSIAAHFLNNFVAVTAYYIKGSDITNNISENTAVSISIAIISAALTTYLLLQLWGKNVKKHSPLKKTENL